ncbi:putative polygalacturonase [Camellia lanceoleosa]|uniref:Polygalacturonase n=1 Tax=Camellia lanceoleosa TaxID=1840588 RepID=A0ACC0HEA8_9ERIC|nr:putative polygalacturonase [Camellia lanceoleosa]
MKAWEAICKATGAPTVIVLAGKNFLLTPITFGGFCSSNTITVQVEGNIVARSSLSQWPKFVGLSKWISFQFVNRLIINGGGQINGQGSIWWNAPVHHLPNDNMDFSAVHFSECNNLQLSGLHSINPPRNHITINNCKNVIISHINLNAPGNSPNIDGIDISGDDCISIRGNSSLINITSITGGPCHGISVGSLGQNLQIYEIVEQVYVGNSTLMGTTNGVRIKTWQGESGYAKNITFEHITFFRVGNPIIINQSYKDNPKNDELESVVQISDVTYTNINGSSVSDQAITLNCSVSKPCTNIVMGQINLFSSVPGGKITSFYQNAHGTSISTIPNVTCLLG